MVISLKPNTARVGAIIQCRMSSSRLPQKCLLRFPNNQTIIEKVIANTCMVRGLDEVIVAMPAEDRGSELSARSGARRSIVAKGFIRKGEELTEANLDCKRPGTGIPASSWDYVINKIAARDYQPNECITWGGLR